MRFAEVGVRPAGGSDRGGRRGSCLASGEQAAAEEGAFQGAVSVHSSAAESRDLTGRVQTGNRGRVLVTIPQ